MWSPEGLSISPNEAVGVAVLDLDFLLNLARAKGHDDDAPIERQRTLVKLTQDGGVPRGVLEVEVSLMRKGAAAVAPVGLGREPPNRDPFLPEPVREVWTWGQIFAGISPYRILCCLIILAVPAIALAVVFTK